MTSICELCGRKKVPTEENTFVCPVCGQSDYEIPQICNFCHEHIASMPSDHGTWICENCIMQALVGPADYEEILATHTRLSRTRRQPVSLGEAFTAWRELTESTKISPRSPAKEVKADAS